MPVSRRTKIIVAVLAIPLFLLLISLLVLKFYFTSERLKAIILPKIQAATKREVNIKEIGLSIFPTFGVKVDGLSIENRKGPGFSERPLLHLDEFVLDVKLLPLLANRFEVNQLVFHKPSILLEVNKDGEENFSDAQKEEGKEQEREKGLTVRAGGGGSLLLSNFEIKDGEFEYVNMKENRALRMKGLDMRLRVETIAEVNEMRTESEVKIARFSYGTREKPLIDSLPLSLKQKSKIIVEENTLTLEQGDLDIQGLKFRMVGALTVVDEKPSFVDFTVNSENLDLEQILSLLPRGLLKETESAEIKGNSRIGAAIKGDVGEGKWPEISVEASLSDGKIQYPNLPKAISDVSFKAKLVSSGSASKLEVTDFSAKFGQNPVKMRIVFNDLSDPVVDADIDAVLNLSEVKEFYPLEAGKELSGLVRARVSIKGKPSAPLAMKGSGTLELRNVVAGSAETAVRNLNGVVAVSNQLIETKGLKMNYGPSDLTLSFALRNYLSAIFPSVHEKSRQKTAEPSMNLSLTSTYFESTPSKEPIVLPPFDVDATVRISKFVYKGKEPFECTDLQGKISASEKVLRLKNVSLQALAGSINATGTIDLRNPKEPQFDISTEVNGVDGHALLKRFSSFGEHLFGKFSVTVALKGALNDTLGLISKSLSGDGNVRLADGKVTGYPVLARLSSFLELPELREFTFKSWSGAFKISDGKINLPDMKIGANSHDFLLSGWHGLDGSLEYKLTIKLSDALSNRFVGTSAASQLANLFKDKEGRVMLFLLVGGTTDDPKFRWDTRAAQERLREKVAEEVEKKREEVREKAKEGLQKKLDEGKKKIEEQLKKLFKK